MWLDKWSGENSFSKWCLKNTKAKSCETILCCHLLAKYLIHTLLIHTLKMANNRHSGNLSCFLSPQRADQGPRREVFPCEIKSEVHKIFFSGIGNKISQLQNSKIAFRKWPLSFIIFECFPICFNYFFMCFLLLELNMQK